MSYKKMTSPDGRTSVFITAHRRFDAPGCAFVVQITSMYNPAYITNELYAENISELRLLHKALGRFLFYHSDSAGSASPLDIADDDVEL